MKLLNARIYVIALFISIVSINTGCKKDGIFCEKGKGSMITEDRSVGSFTRVKQDMDATVYVSQGAEYKVTVEAQGNLMDAIGTDVDGGELRVYTKHCIRKHDPIRVYVTMPTVNGITVAGAGSVYTTSRIETSSLGLTISGSGSLQTQDSVIADYCNATIAGSGSINVTGRFSDLITTVSGSGDVLLKGAGVSNGVTISGSGDVRAFDLPVKTCSVTIGGSGNAEVNVSDHLDVTIGGSGSVQYKGDATTSVTLGGSGSVVHVP